MSPLGEFQRDLVEITRMPGGYLAVGRHREIQEHGLLEPLVDLPAVGGGFGHAGLAAVEQADCLVDGRAQFGGRAVGREFRTLFVRGFDDVAQVLHFRLSGVVSAAY